MSHSYIFLDMQITLHWNHIFLSSSIHVLSFFVNFWEGYFRNIINPMEKRSLFLASECWGPTIVFCAQFVFCHPILFSLVPIENIFARTNLVLAFLKKMFWYYVHSIFDHLSPSYFWFIRTHMLMQKPWPLIVWNRSNNCCLLLSSLFTAFEMTDRFRVFSLCSRIFILI